MRSIAGLKRPVFLDGNKFRLRIPIGKPIGFPNPSVGVKYMVIWKKDEV